MFYPSDTNLGTVLEFENFSFQIYYETESNEGEENGEGGVVTRYPVKLLFNQVNPPTVNKTEGDPASLSGYFYDSFENSIQYRTPQDTFITVEKFDEVGRNNLSEMIYYLADTRRTVDYTYTANAMDNDEIIASTIYTITVQNDWTSGKTSLQTYVGYTR
jgi:hypothetical protein